MTIKYTREMLAEAAANSRSIPDVLRYLGIPTGGSLHSHIGRRLKTFGIDTSHFTGSSKYRVEVLREAVEASTSVAGVLRYLGLAETGGAHSHISRRIKALGLDTSHFRRYQGAKNQVHRRAAEQLLVFTATRSRRERPELLRRALLESGRAYECELCGCDGSWNGRTLTLHVDHLSGDFRDNRAENLRFLCPNCHATTPNFAGRANSPRWANSPEPDAGESATAAA